MNTKHYLTRLYCGKVAQCYGIETAMNKVSVVESLHLSFEGLAGDECADKIHHGGSERALHQYPLEHYAYWQEKYGLDVNYNLSGMGENISTEGMTETTVCLGDRYQWGNAIIEVSQPRSPCFKLNERWGIKDFSVDIQEISRCGWLYRVIQPGIVSVNEPLQLITRVANAMTINDVCATFFGDPLNKAKLLTLRQQTSLSSSWMDKLAQRLVTNQVENWNFRLLGHA